MEGRTKKCPYCAEVIQHDAVVCKYCGRTVKGRYRRRIVMIIVIVAAATFLYTHQYEARRAINNVQAFFKDIKDSLLALRDTLKELPRSTSMMKESQEEINKLANSIRNIKVE